MYLCISVFSNFLMQATTENLWIGKLATKTLDPRNTHEKKFWTHKTPTRKKFRPTKKPTTKKFGPTKYPWQKSLDLLNTYDKNFWTDKIPTRRNTQEKKFRTHKMPMKARWIDGTRPTRPTMTRDPRKLEHSFS